jgi:hypothetical protein
MNHVQAVTVVEATTSDNIKNGPARKRLVPMDRNNNVQHVTKESLNIGSRSHADESDQPQEYKLLGLVTFKSPIKWLNSISIILIHLIFCYGFFTYPLAGKVYTTLWGKQRLVF